MMDAIPKRDDLYKFLEFHDFRFSREELEEHLGDLMRLAVADDDFEAYQDAMSEFNSVTGSMYEGVSSDDFSLLVSLRSSSVPDDSISFYG